MRKKASVSLNLATFTTLYEYYCGAYVLDPDGHNIEAVCREPAED